MKRYFLVICVMTGFWQGCRSSNSRNESVAEAPVAVKTPDVPTIVQPSPNPSESALSRDAANAAESEKWKAMQERNRSEVESNKAELDRIELERVLAERKRLENLGKDQTPVDTTPIPDITITAIYNFGRIPYSGGSLEVKQDAYIFSKPTFETLVSRGLSCELKAISNTVFSCDYRILGNNHVGSNCKEACWINGEGNTCRECFKPSLANGREQIATGF